MMDSTKRFSDRVESYKRFRPSYTTEVIDYIFSGFGLLRDSTIADVGSGTGIFTEKLIGRCKRVYAVEPNREMRIAAEEKLSSFESYVSVAGTSEDTSLDDTSVDAITVAQAFHWFNIDKTRTEFRRVLKKDSFVFLIWNNRISNTPFLKAYNEILLERIPEYKVVDHKNVTEDIIRDFLVRDYSKVSFPNNQVFDLEGVLGRLNSSSYTPKQESNEYVLIEKDIKNAFQKYSSNGLVSFNYMTEVYSGKIT